MINSQEYLDALNSIHTLQSKVFADYIEHLQLLEAQLLTQRTRLYELEKAILLLEERFRE